MTSKSKATTPKPNSPIMSLDEFRKRHDKSTIVPQKIKAGLAKLREKKGWCYEKDFIALCELNANDFAAFRGQFVEEFAVPVKNESRHETRAWAGSKAVADKLREMLGVVA